MEPKKKHVISSTIRCHHAIIMEYQWNQKNTKSRYYSKFYFPIPIWAPKRTGRFHQPHPRGPVFVTRPVVPLVPLTSGDREVPLPLLRGSHLAGFRPAVAGESTARKITQTFDG